MKGLIRFLGVGIACTAFAYFQTKAQISLQFQEVSGSDQSALDDYGHAVAIHNNVAIVGARAHDHHATNDGGIYIYSQDSSGQWIEEQHIAGSVDQPNTFFGTSVEIYHDQAFVGSINDHEAPYFSTGAVYVYKREPDGNWTINQKIIPPVLSNSFGLGRTLAVNDSFLVVGASGRRNASGRLVDEVLFYDKNGTTGLWEYQQSVTPGDFKINDQFGWNSISISDHTVAIGARGHGVNGAVYLYERQGGQWNFKQKISGDPGSSGQSDRFGISVSIEDDVMVIGADAYDPYDGVQIKTNGGQIYIYSKDSSGFWVEQQRLSSCDVDRVDQLGSKVAISNGVIAAAAFRADVSGQPFSDRGAVYLFGRDNQGDWSQLAKIRSFWPAQYANFGYGLDFSDHQLVISAVPDILFRRSTELGRVYFVDLEFGSQLDYGCGYQVVDTDWDGTEDELDGCPYDPNKIDPGVCGCGSQDTDGDGDGTPDCIDACPVDSQKITPGICGCGISDADTDGDGTVDCRDACPSDVDKTDPGICGCGVSDADTDGDGTADCLDACPADVDKTDPGICGCGVSDADTDGDGTADCLDACPADVDKTDPGICGCGVLDADTDGDGTADCLDACPLDVNKTNPGLCGCGVPENDSDGDGVPDCLDICPGFADQMDNDQNGIPDGCDVPFTCLADKFTILALEHVLFYGDNTVASGGVGVYGPEGEVEIKGAVNISGPTTFVQSAILKNDGGRVLNYLPEEPGMPLNRGYRYTDECGPDVNVDPFQSVTLDEAFYGKISVSFGARVIFTQETVYLKSLNLSSFSALFIESCTNILIEEDLDIKAFCNVNTEQNPLNVYIGKKVSIDFGVQFYGNIDCRQGELKIDSNRKWPTSMTGLFIARSVNSRKGVIWSAGAHCQDSCLPMMSPLDCPFGLDEETSQPRMSAAVKQSNQQIPPDIVVYPNPTAGKVTIETGNQSDPLTQITLVNAFGQTLYSKLIGDATFINMDLSAYSSGMYYVIISTSHHRRTVKKIMLRRASSR